MRRNMNKLVHDIIEDYLENIAKTGSIITSFKKFGDEGGYKSKEMNLFKVLDEKKLVAGYLESKGLDAWKRGTKEPQAIKEFLATTKWEDIQCTGVQAGKSMWD